MMLNLIGRISCPAESLNFPVSLIYYIILYILYIILYILIIISYILYQIFDSGIFFFDLSIILITWFMLGSVARTHSHLSNPVATFAHNFFHRLRVSVWRYYSYYYYIFSESCAAVVTFSAGIGLLTAPFLLLRLRSALFSFSLIIIIIIFFLFFSFFLSFFLFLIIFLILF